MRPAVLALALAALAPLAAAQPAPDTFTVLVQTPEGEPIVGASVLLGTRGASTGADGEARVEGVRPGRYRLRVTFLGRQTREFAAVLDAPGPWGLVVEMAEAPLALGGVVVEARDLRRSRLAADGFFDRLRFGGGSVLTVEDLRPRSPRSLAHALRGVLGVRVRPTPTGAVATAEVGGQECVMAVYLDGSPAAYARENLDAVPGADLVAVEVYRRPSQIPIRYNQLGRTDGCGVVLAWTAASLDDTGRP